MKYGCSIVNLAAADFSPWDNEKGNEMNYRCSILDAAAADFSPWINECEK